MRQRKLSLPEEFVLLLHRPNGNYYVTHDQTRAAELGELVLRGLAELKDKKIRALTDDVTGDDWVDELMESLRKKAGPTDRPVDVSSTLAFRSSSIKTHRASLVERGLLTRESKKFLGFIPDDRYCPHEITRSQLIAKVGQAARGERSPDNQLAMLCALVHASGLENPLGYDKHQRATLKEISNGENVGAEVDSAIAAATALLVTTTVATTVIVPGES